MTVDSFFLFMNMATHAQRIILYHTKTPVISKEIFSLSRVLYI
jgi:hypothetical protein